MRLQGKIIRWDDDRGFGFVAWHGDASSVFVHIKAFTSSARRPMVGDIITYEIEEQKNGKKSAINVRFSDQERRKKRASMKAPKGPLATSFAWTYLGFLLVMVALDRLPWVIIALYLLASIVTFAVYGMDKSSARAGRWRTPESTLHLLSLVGGWPGGLLAQRWLRHKSSKQAFLTVFWATVLINIAAVCYLAWLGEASPIYQLLTMNF